MSGCCPVLRCLVVALVLTVPIAKAAQAPGAPALEWPPVVDLYLDGRVSDAAAVVLARRPDEVTAAARAAFRTWTREAGATPSNDARRLQRRRLQASAMLPLEILLAIRMPAQPSPRLSALELIGQDALDRLDAAGGRGPGPSVTQSSSGRHASFRAWWRLGLLQFLVATGRYEDFRRHSDGFGTPTDDEAAAEHHFLRGLAAETQARLPEEASVGSGSRAEAARPRATFIADALGEARREYARALALRPAHAESRLRLARVELDTDPDAAARGELTRLATEPCTDVTCGLAWLFLGQAAERIGDDAAAAAAFARAARVPLVSRAARISELRLGVRGGAGEELLRLADTFADSAAPRTRGPQPDGWAMYLSGQRTDGDLVTRRLRALVEP
jgi:hypothetical protein